MERKVLANQLAIAITDEQKLETIVESLGNQIAQSFETLFHLDPEMAGHILSQLSEQINEEVIEETVTKRTKYISDLADKIEPGLHIED